MKNEFRIGDRNHGLVTWNRLRAGRWTDAQVGSLSGAPGGIATLSGEEAEL